MKISEAVVLLQNPKREQTIRRWWKRNHKKGKDGFIESFVGSKKIFEFPEESFRKRFKEELAQVSTKSAERTNSADTDADYEKRYYRLLKNYEDLKRENRGLLNVRLADHKTFGDEKAEITAQVYERVMSRENVRIKEERKEFREAVENVSKNVMRHVIQELTPLQNLMKSMNARLIEAPKKKKVIHNIAVEEKHKKLYNKEYGNSEHNTNTERTI